MRATIAIIALCLLGSAIAKSDPPRPDLHETFESISSAWLKRGSTTVHGKGRWGVDQPSGRAVEEISFDNGTEHHNVFILQRYDQSTEYRVVREGQPPTPHCHKTGLAPPMKTMWSWVKDATYKGEITIRRIPLDYWEEEVSGVTLGVGVNTTNANQPVYFVRKTSSESFELHFDRYFHRQPNASWFEVPKVCQTEETEFKPAEIKFPISNVTAPMNLAAVLSCARQICTCGCPYVWGGNGPCCPGKSGYDCSGMTHKCYSAGGYSTARTAAEQQKQGKACTGGLQAGDLLFLGSPAHHVFMSAGGGMIYECPHTGANCHHVPVYHYDSCRRIA